MNLTLPRQKLLNPLKVVASVVEDRKVMPILSNILLQAEGEQLKLTGSDGEIEVTCTIPIEVGADFAITVPKKLLEITRSLPDTQDLHFTDKEGKEGQVIVKSGKSRFALATLPADDYPASNQLADAMQLELPQATLKSLLKQCAFCIAANDVRYYLTGLLLEEGGEETHCVATDGHRMAITRLDSEGMTVVKDTQSIIIPRKAVLELLKLLGEEGDVQIHYNDTHVRFTLNESLQLTSKLIDGKFPDWRSVIPAQATNVATAPTLDLQSALNRVSLLSNEKYKGVRLTLSANLLTINAKNPYQEEATEDLEIDYAGEALEIGFNCVYLLDVLSVIKTSQVKLAFTDSNSSVLITEAGDDTANNGQWIIMPMRL